MPEDKVTAPAHWSIGIKSVPQPPECLMLIKIRGIQDQFHGLYKRMY